MERKSFEDMACSVAQCLEVVGEWWSMLLIRDVFLGVHRFDEFQQRLGISRNVLTQRLGKLVDAGVLRKQAYQQNPPRYEYRLTDKGRDLWPVLTTMRQWGDRHRAPHGPPVRVTHRSCGHAAELELHCSHCGEKVTHRDVRAEPVGQERNRHKSKSAFDRERREDIGAGPLSDVVSEGESLANPGDD